MWQKLDRVLAHRIDALGLERGLTASHVCAEFDRLIAATLGDDAPIHAVSFRESRLKVEVTGGIWATELRLRLPKIKDELNKKLRDSEIAEIKLQVR
jgi:hypothetical protein